MQDRNDPKERKRVKRKKKRGDGNQTSRSGATDETHSTTSSASGGSGASGGSSASNRSGKSGSSGGSESSVSQRSNLKQSESKRSGVSMGGNASRSTLYSKLSKVKKRAMKKVKTAQSKITMKSGESKVSLRSSASSASGTSGDSSDSQQSRASRGSVSSRSFRSSVTSTMSDNKMGQSKDPMFEKMQKMQQGQDAHQGAQHPGMHPGMHQGIHPDTHQGMMHQGITHPGVHQDIHQGQQQHLGMDPNMHQGMIHPGMMHDGTYGYSTAQYQMHGQYGFGEQGTEMQIPGEGIVDEKGMVVGANGDILMYQQLVEGKEEFNEEKKEMRHIAEQRAEDVDEKLKHLSNIVPISVTLRMIIGTLLTVVAVSPFYIVAIISLSSLSDKAAQITINECRLVKVIQISAFSTMYVSNTVYSANDTSMIVKIDKYASAAFKDNSFAMSEDNLRQVTLSLQQILNTLTARFQFGGETEAITGDPLLDAFHVPRMQGKDSFVDEIFQGSTDCLFVNTDSDQTRTDICNKVNRLPGMSYPFNGLEQHLIHFHLCVQDTMNKDPTNATGIDFLNEEFQYIIESAGEDIKEGISRIGNYLVDKIYHKRLSNSKLWLL
ncbi:MAG: hypothetical protein EZS28_010068 [Streblomastix strix]|uniref:Uncharacterized protein n=1 Tax=Streblomastix strix TaxID=222440 RepID=A0A5J4WHC2_9EUKA|nr:MAG: hypothetical protein EZS28_010068 [Streblomastix strix]